MIGRVYRPENSRHGIMASILDNYEDSAYIFNIPSGSQNVLTDPDDETPMFRRRRVEFFPSDNITHLCACSEIILVAMANNVLHRINIRQQDVPTEIDLAKYGNVKVAGMFLSPNGQHAIISLKGKQPESSTEFHYLSKNSIKLKPLAKLKGVDITALAWSSWPVTGTSSGPVLIGTSKGVLFETEVGGDGDGLFATGGAECKQVFHIGKGAQSAITGLEMFRKGDRYHVLATTIDEIYHYHEKVNLDEKFSLQLIFKKYLSAPECCKMVQNDSKISKLDLIGVGDEPRQFGWLVGSELYYGPVPDTDEPLANFPPIVCPNGPPHDFLLTTFHALLAYKTSVFFISLLTHQTVNEDNFAESEVSSKPKRILREPTRRSIYVFTDRTVFIYKIRNEDRNVWMEYVQRGEFDTARDFCHGNQVYLDRVTTKQAEALFDESDYELSAYYFAQSASISFEEVAMKFLRAHQTGPLMRFLKLRLEGLAKEDEMQRAMLVVWLVELYLSKLGKCAKFSVEYNQLQSDLDELLAMESVQDCVAKNKGTIYDLMASHGDTVNLVKLSLAHLDYERVIRQHIFRGEYNEALLVLRKTLPSRSELVYTFAPSLMAHIPNELLKFFTENAGKLTPTKLLPALALTYGSHVDARAVAQYLQYCIDNLRCTDQSIHNLLLTIYAEYQPDRLRVYLAKEGTDPDAVHYDVHFALRLCREKGLTEACVQLSALLGLWSSAVEMALNVNVELAEQTANFHTDDPDLLKTLWLKIAKHVVDEKKNIKSAMEFLKKCPLLKIEDILPLFPDCDTIDDFKEAICNSLQDYNQRIQYLKDEMNESTKSADMIVQEMSAFKNRHMVISWADSCAACELQLLLRAFYIFPCSHHFHIDCLKETVWTILPPSTRQRLMELQRQLATVGADDVSTASSVTTARDLIQSGIDSILAGECPLCGDTMVDSIDQPFVADKDFDVVLKEWE